MKKMQRKRNGFDLNHEHPLYFVVGAVAIFTVFYLIFNVVVSMNR